MSLHSQKEFSGLVVGMSGLDFGSGGCKGSDNNNTNDDSSDYNADFFLGGGTFSGCKPDAL